MLKKTIPYVDYNGNKRTEDAYFNLTQTEALEIAFDLPEGIAEASDELTEENKEQVSLKLVEKLGGSGILKFIKDLVKKSYGIKSSDGKRFEKSEQLYTEFSQTPAFDVLIMELLNDDVAAAQFVNAVIPAELAEKISDVNGKKAVTGPTIN